jgi:hypothetical protein
MSYKLRLSLLAIFLGMFVPTPSMAGPVMVARVGPVSITLYDESCAIAAVANLQRRATWAENGKVFEGCFGVSEIGVVMLYFAEDRSVGAVPTEMFVRVTSA